MVARNLPSVLGIPQCARFTVCVVACPRTSVLVGGMPSGAVCGVGMVRVDFRVVRESEVTDRTYVRVTEVT